MENKMCSIHPGEILLKEFMEPANINVNQISMRTICDGNWDDCIDVISLQNIIEGKVDINKSIARGLAKACGTTSEFWINLQNSYDAKIGK